MNQKIKWNIYLITSAIAILGLAMLSCMGGIKATTVSGEVSYKSFEESGMTAVEYNAACPFFAPPVCTPTTNTFCVDGLTNAWKYDCELRRGADFLRADPEFTEARLEAEAISVGDEIVEEDGESVQSSQSLDLENSGQESESLSEEERTARLNEAIGWLKVEAESAERDEAQIKKAFAQIQAFKAVLDLKDKEERDAIEAAFDYAMSIFRGEGNSRDGQYNGTQASSGSSSGGQISGVTNAGLGSVAAGQAAQTLEGLTIMTVGCCDGRTINEILGWSSKTGFNVHELKTIAGELPAGWQDLIVKAEPDLIISLMHGELEAGCPGCGGRTLAGGVSSGSSVLDDWVLISKIDPSAWKQSMKVADQLDGFWYVTENNVSILSGLTSNSAQGVYPTGALVNGRWQYLSEAEFNAVLLGEANPLLSRGVLTSEMRAVMNANAVAIEAGGATATELALGTGQGMNRLVFNFTTRPPYELSDDIYNAFYVEGVGVADSYFGITTHLDDIGNSLKQAIYPLSHAPAHMDIYLIGTQAEVDALWFELQNWGKFQDLILNNFSHTGKIRKVIVQGESVLEMGLIEAEVAGTVLMESTLAESGMTVTETVMTVDDLFAAEISSETALSKAMGRAGISGRVSRIWSRISPYVPATLRFAQFGLNFYIVWESRVLFFQGPNMSTQKAGGSCIDYGQSQGDVFDTLYCSFLGPYVMDVADRVRDQGTVVFTLPHNQGIHAGGRRVINQDTGQIVLDPRYYDEGSMVAPIVAYSSKADGDGFPLNVIFHDVETGKETVVEWVNSFWEITSNGNLTFPVSGTEHVCKMELYFAPNVMQVQFRHVMNSCQPLAEE